MQIAQTDVQQPPKQQTWTLHHLTDLHIDAKDHAERELAERIKEIKDDPHALWVGGGDYGDLILPGDKRTGSGWHPDAIVERLPDWYVERVTDTLAPIASKCVGFGIGNHESTVMTKWHRGVAAEVCANLGLEGKYLGWRGWAIVTFRHGQRESQSVKVYQYHGWSTGRLKGRKALQAERDLGAWDADVLCLGHDHQPYIDVWHTEESYYSSRGDEKWKLRTRPRCVMNGGSWTYGGLPPTDYVGKRAMEFPNEMWVEGKNFRPQPPSSPRLKIHVDMGHSANSRGAGYRPMGFDFTAEMPGQRRYYQEAA